MLSGKWPACNEPAFTKIIMDIAIPWTLRCHCRSFSDSLRFCFGQSHLSLLGLTHSILPFLPSLNNLTAAACLSLHQGHTFSLHYTGSFGTYNMADTSQRTTR